MRSYEHFTREERIKLQEMYRGGKKIREMARALGRSPSSVSRELRRNRNKNGSYHFWRACNLYTIRRKNCQTRNRLAEGTEINSFVRARLQMFWPPETIAHMWNMEHPDDRVGFSTIYRWLKAGKLEGCSRKKHLRRKGKKIQTRNANYNTIHPDRLIADWPEEIRQRLRIGDWEGDTIYGGVGKGFLVTAVDRKTRFVTAAIVRSRKPDDTKEALVEALRGLAVSSLSLDNGSEFAHFREMEQTLHAPVFFAHPHAPWERGSNENMNGLLRFFFPKGYNFLELDPLYLRFVLALLNSRPRRCLGWLSPAQLFFSSSVALA